MAFENLKMGITMLMDEIEKRPKDRLELEEQIREKLAEFRSLGLPLPEDLVKFEKALEDNPLPTEDTPAASDDGAAKG